MAVDFKHRLIRSYEVTNAVQHDNTVFEALLFDNTENIWATSAYRWQKRLGAEVTHIPEVSKRLPMIHHYN